MVITLNIVAHGPHLWYAPTIDYWCFQGCSFLHGRFLGPYDFLSWNNMNPLTPTEWINA